MAGLHAIHYTAGSNHAGWFRTHCGLVGYPDKDVSDEFETAGGRRFEAKFRDWKRVTCERCLRNEARRLAADTAHT